VKGIIASRARGCGASGFAGARRVKLDAAGPTITIESTTVESLQVKVGSLKSMLPRNAFNVLSFVDAINLDPQLISSERLVTVGATPTPLNVTRVSEIA
jgi:hypothetical protein